MSGETQVNSRGCLQLEATIDSGGTQSNAITFDGRPILGLLVPAVNGTGPAIVPEVSEDVGVTWNSLLDKDGASEAIEVTGGAAAFVVSSDDLSPLAGYCDRNNRVRLVIDTAQSAERTFKWFMVG